MTEVGILVAFLAGIVSFASPCCLPMVPAYVGYMVSTSEPDAPGARRMAFNQAIAFVLGFSVVFVALWASVGLVGYFLRDYAGLLRIAGGTAIVVVGLHVAGLISVSALTRDFRLPVGRLKRIALPAGDGRAGDKPSYVRSSLLGVIFAAGWTPCVGPILGGIIGLASVSGSVAQGTVLLVAYALGLGIPFILVAVGASEVNGRLSWFRRHHEGVSMVSGAMLILVGFLMITNLWARSSGFLPRITL